MALRIVSLFNKDLRRLLQVAPNYMKPARYDACKLLWSSQMTSYDGGIAQAAPTGLAGLFGLVRLPTI